MKKQSSSFKTSIGGQAVLEGIMMRNDSPAVQVDKCSLAVRKPDGNIELEVWESQKVKRWYRRVPFVRGSFNFVHMLILGYKTLMRSAELSGLEEEEPSAFEKKLQEKLGAKMYDLFGIVVFVLAMILALGLFMFLPSAISYLLQPYITSQFGLTAMESIIKIMVFTGYLAAVSCMKEIRTVFEYHGAEHKTIFCYENGKDLTVENVREFSRFHPRCGTSFLIITLIISILVFSVVTWNSLFIRIILKLILLPVVVGISYEIIKFAGRHDNLLTRIISAPGIWLQHLTTREPNDSQIEVAIAAINAVIPQDKNDAVY